LDRLIASKWREELTANQIPAEDEKEIYPDPPKPMGSTRKWKSHHPCVENNHKNNGERAEKVETGLAFTIGKTRVDCRFPHKILEANVADPATLSRGKSRT
jgi:hypothetical protein